MLQEDLVIHPQKPTIQIQMNTSIREAIKAITCCEISIFLIIIRSHVITSPFMASVTQALALIYMIYRLFTITM